MSESSSNLRKIGWVVLEIWMFRNESAVRYSRFSASSASDCSHCNIFCSSHFFFHQFCEEKYRIPKQLLLTGGQEWGLEKNFLVITIHYYFESDLNLYTFSYNISLSFSPNWRGNVFLHISCFESISLVRLLGWNKLSILFPLMTVSYTHLTLPTIYSV